MNLLEGILGGGGGVGGLFGEFREGFIGGCLGLLMSAVFFFFFFFTLLGWLFGVDMMGYTVQGAASPVIALFCVSALLSPVLGILWGAQTGAYSILRHTGCFVMYVMALLAGVFALSVLLYQ